MLAARIDRLPHDARRLLQAASVIGHDVPEPLLAAVAETDEEALRAGIGRLRAGEFLCETAQLPEVVYAFTHTLTREVAY